MLSDYDHCIIPCSLTYRSKHERDNRIPSINIGNEPLLKALPHKARVRVRVTFFATGGSVEGVMTKYKAALYGASMKLPPGWPMRSRTDYRLDFSIIEDAATAIGDALIDRGRYDIPPAPTPLQPAPWAPQVVVGFEELSPVLATSNSIIINVRGGHGAGKTTALRSLVGDDFEQVLISPANAYGNHDSIHGRLNRADDLIVWRAENIPVPALYNFVVDALKHANRVLFEGARVSFSFLPVVDVARRLEPEGHVFIDAFLDTPSGLCYQRVLARPRSTGTKRAVTSISDLPRVIAHDREARSIWRRLPAERPSERLALIDHSNPVESLRQLLAA